MAARRKKESTPPTTMTLANVDAVLSYETEGVHAEQLDSFKQCPVCSRDLALHESLLAVVDNSRAWLSTHPYDTSGFPSLNNVKQMLMEGCDFASAISYCVTNGLIASTFATFRCLLERVHYAIYFLEFPHDANWEHHGMAKLQGEANRWMQQNAQFPGDLEWAKKYLASIRNWNRGPDDDPHPTTMGKPRSYRFDIGDMYPAMQLWYDRCSDFVHPTYPGNQNVGRALSGNEADAVIHTAHIYLCTIAQMAYKLETLMTDDEAWLLDAYGVRSMGELKKKYGVEEILGANDEEAVQAFRDARDKGWTPSKTLEKEVGLG